MKRIYSVFCFVLCAVMLFSFTSCKKNSTAGGSGEEKPFEPSDAIALWNKIDETMCNIKSNETDMTMKMVQYLYGMKYDLSGTNHVIEVESDGDFYSYTQQSMTVTCEEAEYSETSESVTAYYNGKMYISNKSEGVDQKFCSAMTAEEFIEADSDDSIKDIDFTDCAKSEFSKNEDGTWNLKFSAYTKKQINVMLDGMEMEEGEMGADILDMEVTVLADTEFRAKQMSIKLVFEIEEDSTVIPEFAVTNNYSKFNEAQPNPDAIKTEEYTEVDDVRVLDNVEDSIKDIQNASSGKFKYDLKQSTRVYGQTSTYTEKNTITYGKENGGYYYDVSANISGTKYTINYKGGKQTITQGSEKNSTSQSEEDAKAFIDGLIDCASYHAELVSKIEKTDEGVYKFTIDNPDISEIKQNLAASEIAVKSGSQEMIVTLSDGSVTRIENKLKINATYKKSGANASVTITVTSTVDFESIAASSVGA